MERISADVQPCNTPAMQTRLATHLLKKLVDAYVFPWHDSASTRAGIVGTGVLEHTPIACPRTSHTCIACLVTSTIIEGKVPRYEVLVSFTRSYGEGHQNMIFLQWDLRSLLQNRSSASKSCTRYYSICRSGTSPNTLVFGTQRKFR